MKRFLLIVINSYYPNGGINDVDSSVETEDEALEWFNEKVDKSKGDSTYQVFDCEKREIIRDFSK